MVAVGLTATAARIRHAREAAGLTQVELARAAGVDARSVQRYEAGEAGNAFQRRHVLATAEAEVAERVMEAREAHADGQ